MASTGRAPKQWSLSKTETISSFESWRQNLLYVLSLDNKFSNFLEPNTTWGKKTKASPKRGFIDDAETVSEAQRKTAQQKVTSLELMLGQIANFCPIISRNTIVRNNTCLNDIWQAIRLHFGFQSSGAYILDLAEYRLETDESPEDLYQRLMSFTEDNLLQANSSISHHGENVTDDEELTPTLENFVVLTWLRLLHPGLPKFVKQRYGTELRSKTLASIKPEISIAMTSLLEDVRTTEDAQVMRGMIRNDRSKQREPATINRSYESTKSCSLCRSSGRQANHYLSRCTYLSEADRKFLTRARRIDATLEDEACAAITDVKVDRVLCSNRVQVEQSPYLAAFHKYTPLRITLDSGATGNMIKYSTACQLGARIVKTKQEASQADGSSRLEVLGETDMVFTRDDHQFKFDGLVVRHLDVDVLGGVPFMKVNDILVRPSMSLVTVGGHYNYTYQSESQDIQSHHVRRTQATLLRAPEQCTVWPGDYLELTVPDEHMSDSQVILEPRLDTRLNHSVGSSDLWPKPTITNCVGRLLRIPNTAPYPVVVNKGEHLVQIQPVRLLDLTSMDKDGGSVIPSSVKCTENNFLAVDTSNSTLDPERIEDFKTLHRDMSSVFEPSTSGYNACSGPVKAVVNVGPVQPPQRKGRVPQYSRNRLVELQDKFDQLEQVGVFRRPEDIGVVVEYLNPSFLVRKSNGGSRLVTAFNEVAKYCKPQPSLMPDVNSVLRSVAQWKYIISTDLSSAFYQIHLDRGSLKYCGVATPFRGIRVYTRCAMGMPGSETALEELMCRILGDMLVDGIVVKIADDLYCGGNTQTELFANWKRLLKCLSENNISISAAKTKISPKTTTILGWKWSTGGILEASPHKVAPLTRCSLPVTTKDLRSFIGAYKILSRVIPKCSQYLSPLDDLLSDHNSSDRVPWTDESRHAFASAQKALSTCAAIVLPRPSDKLWIVTDGANVCSGIGATLYVERLGVLRIAGFFSAKVRKPQIRWLPCEIEALSIAAAVKHFSPFVIQSAHQAVVLTDSKPCVQAHEKLNRGQFSASPRVSTFLTTASRYQVAIRHIAGATNLLSDFSSRNAVDCIENSCQVCKFVSSLDEAVIRTIDAHDILSGQARLPFVSRAAWRLCQNECPDLRRVRAHLLQGTRPSKKITNINNVKRYLNHVSVASDGMLVVLSSEPLRPDRECTVIPQQSLAGFLTALHLRLDHPSCYQLTQVVKRYFFALGLDTAVKSVSDSCHQCASLRAVSHVVVPQSSETFPSIVGSHFAADVLKRSRQLVLVLREHITSYTAACIISDERKIPLKEGLIRLSAELRPVEGPMAVIRTDPAPGFVSLARDMSLDHFHIKLDIGSPKNINKNPVAEKAIQELEREVLRRDPTGSVLTQSSLALAVSALNSRIRGSGLSATEMWTHRDQFTGEQIPLSDVDLIGSKTSQHSGNHAASTKSKCPKLNSLPSQNIGVGDLVYLNSEGNKLRARDRYPIVGAEESHSLVRKFTASQFRARTYEVKRSDCFKIACNLTPCVRSCEHQMISSDEEDGHEPTEADTSQQEATANIGSAGETNTSVPQLQAGDVGYRPSLDDSVVVGDVHPDDASVSPFRPRRSSRLRQPPSYLADYECD